MAKKSKRLVLRHLENISWQVLRDYPETVRDMIRRKSGVYALYRRGQLYYIGLASNLMGRLKQHLTDRHTGAWDRFSVYLTVEDDHMKELESLMLRIVDPKGNRVKGNFIDSENLRKTLDRAIADTDTARRRKLLMGGRSPAQRTRPTKKSSKKTKKETTPITLDKPVRLRRVYKGDTYTATLRKDGRVSYGGAVYESLSAAAVAITNRPMNGWLFWRFKNQDGDWVPVDHLRR